MKLPTDWRSGKPDRAGLWLVRHRIDQPAREMVVRAAPAGGFDFRERLETTWYPMREMQAPWRARFVRTLSKEEEAKCGR